MSVVGDIPFGLGYNPPSLAAGLIPAAPLGMGLSGKHSGVWKIPD